MSAVITLVHIKMTDKQAKQLSCFAKEIAALEGLETSGAIVAQVYPDAYYGCTEFVCGVIDHKAAKGMRKVIFKYRARLAKETK